MQDIIRFIVMQGWVIRQFLPCEFVDRSSKKLYPEAMMIALTKEQEAQLDQLVQTGKFESAEQFINYSLAVFAAEDAEHNLWLKAAVLKGLASLDRAQYSNRSTEEIAAEGARQLDQQSNA